MFADKVILITGGTGSFGQKMVEFFLNNTEIGQVRVYSRDEEKQDRMRNKFNDSRIKYYIGDVRDYGSISEALNGVDFVFHAAALKQVPSCEFYPMEAVNTNVLGARNVINACVENKVKKAIVLSTDKAVYPINVMGMTKALMEKLMVNKSRNVDPDITTFAATRYGNVMASRGSVIPLFVKQCKENAPITITDPDMTRFLMSLDDSVALVIFAFERANTGDIFVQKAPAATIADIAKAVQRIFKADNGIKIIGTRHGEKEHETLINREEISKAEDLGNFYRIPADVRDLNYNLFFDKGSELVTRTYDYTSANTKRLSVDEVMEKLLQLDYIQMELREKNYVGVSK
ncbi:MAG: polysaccharide biosynthesis protein [Planctomycetaceae bacterium]|nr:polysaccharide biosynthesis protein [Planctomycetaceae bacterium]